MATSDSWDLPPLADAVGLAGILVASAGLLLTAGRLVLLVWRTWGWWSGPVYLAAGLALLVLAVLGRLLVRKVSQWHLERRATSILRRSEGGDGE